MNRVFTSILAMSFMSLSGVTQAAELEIEWKDWENYTDIKEGRVETRTSFRESVFKQLGGTFEEEAAKLSADLKMKVVVTNVDLAGDAGPATRAGMEGIRMFKSMYPPRFSFDYSIVDATGKVVAEESVKLSDLSYLDKSSMRADQDRFYYDKQMIERWFKRKLKPTFGAE